MVWVLSFELWCDGPGEDGKGCGRASDAELDRKGAVEWAKQCGWLILTRKHYCPKCRRLKEKYASTK